MICNKCHQVVKSIKEKQFRVYEDINSESYFVLDFTLLNEEYGRFVKAIKALDKVGITSLTDTKYRILIKWGEEL